MLRFIIQKSFQDNESGLSGVEYVTTDEDCPNLEKLLRTCTANTTGFERYDLIGVEFLGDSYENHSRH